MGSSSRPRDRGASRCCMATRMQPAWAGAWPPGEACGGADGAAAKPAAEHGHSRGERSRWGSGAGAPSSGLQAGPLSSGCVARAQGWAAAVGRAGAERAEGRAEDT